jgi:cyclopropane fatty-acyl-phospholipid synthase-like methyltransferase
MSVTEPSRIIEDGYDRLDDAYRTWVAEMRGGQRAAFLDEILHLVPPGSDVLEIGCGPGTDAAALADGRRYTGIDLSSVQLAHARRAVPDGTFLHTDVLGVELPDDSFDAVIALYVFGHIPAERTEALFERIGAWLRPGGWLCASFATSDNPGAVEPSWLGVVDMYFSSLPPQRVDTLLREAGFDIRSAETIEEVEPDEGPVTFRWVIARRTGGDA